MKVWVLSLSLLHRDRAHVWLFRGEMGLFCVEEGLFCTISMDASIFVSKDAGMGPGSFAEKLSSMSYTWESGVMPLCVCVCNESCRTHE